MLTDWFYWLCIAIYSATIISIIYIILKENRNPVDYGAVLSAGSRLVAVSVFWA